MGALLSRIKYTGVGEGNAIKQVEECDEQEYELHIVLRREN